MQINPGTGEVQHCVVWIPKNEALSNRTVYEDHLSVIDKVISGQSRSVNPSRINNIHNFHRFGNFVKCCSSHLHYRVQTALILIPVNTFSSGIGLAGSQSICSI